MTVKYTCFLEVFSTIVYTSVAINLYSLRVNTVINLLQDVGH